MEARVRIELTYKVLQLSASTAHDNWRALRLFGANYFLQDRDRKKAGGGKPNLRPIDSYSMVFNSSPLVVL
jgi:hypothetical protein